MTIFSSLFNRFFDAFATLFTVCKNPSNPLLLEPVFSSTRPRATPISRNAPISSPPTVAMLLNTSSIRFVEAVTNGIALCPKSISAFLTVLIICSKFFPDSPTAPSSAPTVPTAATRTRNAPASTPTAIPSVLSTPVRVSAAPLNSFVTAAEIVA